MSASSMTAAEARALPLTVDVPTAGRALGLGRDSAYRLARSGEFPAPVIRAGRRLLITRAALLAVLGIPDDVTAAAPDPGERLASAVSPQVSASATDTQTVGPRP